MKMMNPHLAAALTLTLLFAGCGGDEPEYERDQLDLETPAYPVVHGLTELQQTNCLARGGFEVYTVVPAEGDTFELDSVESLDPALEVERVDSSSFRAEGVAEERVDVVIRGQLDGASHESVVTVDIHSIEEVEVGDTCLPGAKDTPFLMPKGESISFSYKMTVGANTRCMGLGHYPITFSPNVGVSFDASQQERGYLDVTVDAAEASVSPASGSDVRSLDVQPNGQTDPIVQTVSATEYTGVNLGEWRRSGIAEAQVDPEETDVGQTDYLHFSPVVSGDQLCFPDSDVEVSVSDEQICTAELIAPDAFPDDRVADPVIEHRTVSQYLAVTGVGSGTCTLQFDFPGADSVLERDISIVEP